MSTTTVTIADIEQGTRPELIAYLKSVQAYSGHSRDGLDAMRDHALATFKRLGYAEGAADAEATIEQAVADAHPMKATLAAVSARQVEARAAAVPNPDTDPAWAEATPTADTEPGAIDRAVAAGLLDGTITVERPAVAEDRAERLAASKSEHQALTAWVAGGKVGDKPATPNLDALNEAYAAGTPLRSQRRRASSGAGRSVAPRRAEANARKAAKERTPRKVTDTELRLYVATVMAEHPEAARNDELEYAYWVEGLAVSRTRWNTAWAAVLAG